MICSECLMRWRTAALQATGAEPDMHEHLAAGTAPVAAAITSIQGTALCLTHLIECVQPQVASAIVGPNGVPIVRNPGAMNGARHG